jgi:uncharacterized membrane protein (UPF0127 family)
MKGGEQINIYVGETLLASNVRVADTFFARLKGLLGSTQTEGLLIKPCNQVHCFGMKYNIDVIFISQDSIVCHIQPDMKPGGISPIIKKAKSVLELPSGRAKEINVGDKLIFKEG